MLVENTQQITYLSNIANNADMILTKNRSCNVCANACVNCDEETGGTSLITYCPIRREIRTNRTGFMCKCWKPLYPELE